MQNLMAKLLKHDRILLSNTTTCLCINLTTILLRSEITGLGLGHWGTVLRFSSRLRLLMSIRSWVLGLGLGHWGTVLRFCSRLHLYNKLQLWKQALPRVLPGKYCFQTLTVLSSLQDTSLEPVTSKSTPHTVDVCDSTQKQKQTVRTFR